MAGQESDRWISPFGVGGFCKEPEHPRRAEWHKDELEDGGEADPEWAYVRARADSPERRILVTGEGKDADAHYEGEEPPF